MPASSGTINATVGRRTAESITSLLLIVIAIWWAKALFVQDDATASVGARGKVVMILYLAHSDAAENIRIERTISDRMIFRVGGPSFARAEVLFDNAVELDGSNQSNCRALTTIGEVTHSKQVVADEVVNGLRPTTIDDIEIYGLEDQLTSDYSSTEAANSYKRIELLPRDLSRMNPTSVQCNTPLMSSPGSQRGQVYVKVPEMIVLLVQERGPGRAYPDPSLRSDQCSGNDAATLGTGVYRSVDASLGRPAHGEEITPFSSSGSSFGRSYSCKISHLHYPGQMGAGPWFANKVLAADAVMLFEEPGAQRFTALKALIVGSIVGARIDKIWFLLFLPTHIARKRQRRDEGKHSAPSAEISREEKQSCCTKRQGVTWTKLRDVLTVAIFISFWRRRKRSKRT